MNDSKKKLKKLIKVLLFFFIVFFVSAFYKFFLLPLCGDEIWNYGFSYNISKGMIIYKDFNVLQTPLYFFINSLVLKLFGNYLISMHIFDCILIIFLMALLSKKLGLYKSFLLFPFILLNWFPSYNYFSLFLLFLIIYFLEKKPKNNDWIVALLSGLIFITKQSIGVLMIFPVLFYSKNKIKSIIIYFIPFLILCFYLITQGALYDFINYAFLGIFDFNDHNKYFSIFVLFEILSCFYLIIRIWKSHFQDRKLLFILMFQINAYPIFDFQHFLVVFIPILYDVLDNISFFKVRLYYRGLLIFSLYAIIFSYFFHLLFVFYYDIGLDDSNFLYLRNTRGEETELKKYSKFMLEHIEGYDYYFLMNINCYIYKLYNHLPVNQFDLPLNGNMGYRGSKRYIEEMDRLCKKGSCVFVVSEVDFNNYYQLNKEIYFYVLNNYYFVTQEDGVYIYDNLDRSEVDVSK